MNETGLSLPGIVDPHLRHEPFWAPVRADAFRRLVYLSSTSLPKKALSLLRADGFWATCIYRLGRSLRTRREILLVGALSWAFFRTMETLVRLATGIHLDVEASIGPGFYVGHHGAIFVGPGVRLGHTCSIGQMCMVAAAGEGAAGVPEVGDRVFLGAGCKVLGKVRVGDGAAIGANTVVVADVPPGAVVLGVPGRIVGHGGSADAIYLGDGEVPAGERELRAPAPRSPA